MLLLAAEIYTCLLKFKNIYRVDRSVVTFTVMPNHDWKKNRFTIYLSTVNKIKRKKK